MRPKYGIQVFTIRYDKFSLSLVSLQSINLTPNQNKTTFTIFSNRPHPTFSLTLNNTEIQHTTHTKLLGLVIQNNLKWDKHINHTIHKLQYSIHLMKHYSNILPKQILLQLYYQLAFPHLINNITIWGSHKDTSTYLIPLYKTQKRLIRIISHQPI